MRKDVEGIKHQRKKEIEIMKMNQKSSKQLNNYELATSWPEDDLLSNTSHQSAMVTDGSYGPSCFIWAGYLPPGKHTIYIYDRINRIFYEKNVLIDIAPQEPVGKVGKPGPTFDHKIEDLTPQELEHIDTLYPSS